MKKGIFAFVLLMLIALFSVAQADSGFAMEPAFIITEPGTELQFTYTVPEGYVVETEEWSWSPSFTPDGSSQVFLADSYGEGVIWQGDGRISLPEASMVRVSVRLNGTDYIYAYAAVPSPESAFTYTISDGQATITGIRHNSISYVPRLKGKGSCLFPDP